MEPERKGGVYGDVHRAYGCTPVRHSRFEAPSQSPELTKIGRKALHQSRLRLRPLGPQRTRGDARLTSAISVSHRDLSAMLKSRMPNFPYTTSGGVVVTRAGRIVEVALTTPDRAAHAAQPLTSRGQQLCGSDLPGLPMSSRDDGGAGWTGWPTAAAVRGRDARRAATWRPASRRPPARRRPQVQTDGCALFHEPSPIWPWLRMRMPSYGHDADRRSDLIAYSGRSTTRHYRSPRRVEPDLTRRSWTRR